MGHRLTLETGEDSIETTVLEHDHDDVLDSIMGRFLRRTEAEEAQEPEEKEVQNSWLHSQVGGDGFRTSGFSFSPSSHAYHQAISQSLSDG